MARRVVPWFLAVLSWNLAPSILLGADRPTPEAIRAAARAVASAVVEVGVTGRGQGRRLQPGVEVKPPKPGQPWEWRWEFRLPRREGDQPAPNLPWQLPFIVRPGRRESHCCGLVVESGNEKALVLAPRSVVEGAEAVFVRLADGRRLAGDLRGGDRLTGLACIELRGKNIPAARAAGKAPEQGEWLLAVGGPSSGGALVLGIVSTTRPPTRGDMAGAPLFQADMRLPAEMAGCPLVNLRGEVVGVSLAGDGLTKAVAAGPALGVARALAREGKVPRGYLGIAFAPLEPKEQRELGVEGGVRVQQVVPGSPADQAGIEQGDVIVEFDGVAIDEPGAFANIVAARKPGVKVRLTLVRGRERRQVELTLGERPAARAAPGAPVGKATGLGLSLQALTPELARQFNYGGEKGLLITDVAPDSPAARARPVPIRKGELLKEVDRKPVEKVEGFTQALKDAHQQNKRSVLLLVRGKEGTRYTVVDLAR